MNHGGALRGRGALAAVAGILAFLLALAWSQETARSRAVAGRRPELLRLLAARQDRTARLQRQLLALERRARAVAARVGGREAAALRARAAHLAPAAGTEAVAGPGVAVELADSALAERGDPDDADFLIQDVDLQAVVNELWRAGAEAVAINGQRIVSTTAIRSAGGAVLVNYQVLVSPYRVAALGEARRMRDRFEESPTAQRFREWAAVYGLGFGVRTADRIEVPAFRGTVRVRHARPGAV